MARQAPPRHRRSNDPEGVRRRVIDAAYAAFSTQGYHSTSVHDLKREAGATGGALAHHFATKKDLGLAVIRDRVAAAVEETWIRPVLAASTAAEGIQAAFASIIADLEGRGAVSGCPLNNLAIELARHDDDFRVLIDAVFVRWREAIAGKLKADLSAGAAIDLDPEAFAVLVVASYSGAMAMSKAKQDTEPLRVCAEQLAEVMRRRIPAAGR
ncbi:TetR/AcrR family transcriptional regulator [Microvirga makkahensis]|uniref:TetR family transcriptional regulator n=1 Tax=Microvirga makkahensis TaxID=1128670 RepID=A0A7X3MUV1_9HYPH|nr:TetR/AcrR family transcriptional regulator [Microvirga makkahensis]MXQ13649.1 TetR family transcriptional regulator [Microvirga makkahensis]